MKSVFTFAFVLGVLVAITIAGGPPTEEMKKNFDDCKNQEKVSDADVQLFLEHKPAQSPAGKCFMACLFEKSGVIKDGKVNASSLKEKVLKHHPNEEKLANDVVTGCQAITNPQRCEMAVQVGECMSKILPKQSM